MKIIFILSVVFAFHISFCQDLIIKDMGICPNKLTLNELKSKNDQLTIILFYKYNVKKKNCDKSLILDYPEGECNISTFKEKLKIGNNKAAEFDLKFMYRL